ncbi:periplasmic divalent cation tolerance protein [Nocardioides luteus]|uniref:Divalent-cation tolerance protein CutA n=1 Tax=Nocardioides luteus TaxID=1844 RepID=A0ABQ5STH7_9ACTN|nr:divalent-cation tolerance protein CutA [Nocardioides luteus]MDR7313446.1 periplasmic divalent cation tolerance protein [Nocardioides luteus]GGR60934.1 divalent-cation tolerance protein CutA [Nocardioides luteus]GLJ66511.1 divalent-cation tolerance protein CutA [Nocardioides luteus]
MTSDYVTVTVTFDDEKAAEETAATIVRERLAACGQVESPIKSFYWWEGEVQNDAEWRVDFKTRADLLDKLTARVVELHSYDVPQVTAAPIVGGLPAYMDWIRDETSAAS